MSALQVNRRNISKTERNAIVNAWGNKCAYCKKHATSFEIDHIVPHANGGSCELENLCLACQQCNGTKSDTRLPKLYEGLLISVAVRKAKKIKATVEAATQKASKPKVATVAKKPKVEIAQNWFLKGTATGFYSTVSVGSRVTRTLYESVPTSEMAGEEEYIKRQNGMAVLKKIFYLGLIEESYPSNIKLLPGQVKCTSGPLDHSFFEQLGLTHREVVDGLASLLLEYRDKGGSGCDSLNFSCTTSAKDGSCVFAFHKSWAELKLYFWRLQNCDHAQVGVAA